MKFSTLFCMSVCFTFAAGAGIAGAQPAATKPTAIAPTQDTHTGGADHLASDPQLGDYRLGADDKVRIIVYNEPNLTGEYTVNSSGQISFPLIGDVVAIDRTTRDVRQEIEQRLAAGYLRAPQVSIDVMTYRPFFILGEVNKPGDYPYSAGLTVMRAVATANGFTYRADKKHIYIKHPGDKKEVRYDLKTDLPILPGDTLRVDERYF
jgi:polysaccharide export outer membrane protein